MIIRAKTFKAWMKRNFTKDTLRDIANHGAAGGFNGLTYYKDTCALYAKFKDEIWEWLLEDSEEFGGVGVGMNVFGMIAGFSGAKDVGSCDQFENLIVWYAAERVARNETDSV